MKNVILQNSVYSTKEAQTRNWSKTHLYEIQKAGYNQPMNKTSNIYGYDATLEK